MSVVGCGSVVVIDDKDDGPPSIDDDEETGEAYADRSPFGDYEPEETERTPREPAEIACEQPERGWMVFDEDTFECCSDGLAQIVPVDPHVWSEEAAQDEDVRGCCDQLVFENYESLWSGQPLVHDAPHDVLAACCVLKHGNPGCTPWGPPVPPAMPSELDVSWIERVGVA
jgi:hypothetical protein